MGDVRPPRGIGRAGRVMWASIADRFDLEPHELELLRQIARVADRIEACDVAVDAEGVLVEGRTHPLLIESRLQRLTLGRLVAALRLPDSQDVRPQRRGGFRRAYQLRSVVEGGA